MVQARRRRRLPHHKLMRDRSLLPLLPPPARYCRALKYRHAEACVGACNPRCPTSKCICPSEARQPECICLSDDEDGSSLEHAIKCDWASRERGGVVFGTAAKREPVLWRRAAPCVSVCLACAVSVPGETRACMVMVSSIRRQYPNTGYKQVQVYVS